MPRFVFLVALLIGVAAAEYAKFDSQDCRGHDIRSYSAGSISVQECLAMCDRNSACLSIQYNVFNECFLKNYKCTAEEMRVTSRGRMYNKIRAPGYTHLRGKDCPGRDFDGASSSTVEDCARRCTASRFCRSFQFNTSNRCYLKNHRCTGSKIASAATGNLYQKN